MANQTTKFRFIYGSSATHVLHFILVIICFSDLTCGFPNHGIIAYDCTHKDINITHFSLMDVEPCTTELTNITTVETKVQVLQAKHHFDVTVYQCKVVYKRLISYCGMHSHTSLYSNSYKYILREFTNDECLRLHETGSLNVHGEIYIHELRRNTTSRGIIYVSGHIEGSTCTGSMYHDGVNSFPNSVVSYEYEITIKTSTAILDTTSNELVFKSGLSCTYNQWNCIDAIDGFHTWKSTSISDCSIDQFTILYEGLANKTSSEDTKYSRQRTMFTALSNDRMFSIQSIDKYDICGSTGYTTDHTNVYIIETNNIPSKIRTKTSHPKDLNIFTYFNSKITLVEHHIQNQINNLFQHVIYEICKIEHSLLETKLTMARKNPQEFASSFMKDAGYTAVISGEVIYVIQCKAVFVTIRPMTTCYQEIPVSYNSLEQFLSPVTRILQRHGTEIDCTPLLMSKYRFGDRWYNFDGRVLEVKPPNVINPSVNTRWSYDPLPNLMVGGIYDSSSVKKMHDMIYDHDDKRAASNIVSRSMMNKETNYQDYRPANLIHEDYIESKIRKYWDKLISFSTIFGQVTSSMIGLWLLIKGIKYILDSIVHGKILYDIYGFSWRLIAAFWDSLAVCMTHRYLHRHRHGTMPDPEAGEQRPKPPSPVIPEPRPSPIYPTLPKVTTASAPTQTSGRSFDW